MPRPLLDDLYRDGEITSDEYTDLLTAAGWAVKDSFNAVMDVHSAGVPEHYPLPLAPEPVPDMPEYTRPGRKPRREIKGGAVLTGHPLDEEVT